MVLQDFPLSMVSRSRKIMPDSTFGRGSSLNIFEYVAGRSPNRIINLQELSRSTKRSEHACCPTDQRLDAHFPAMLEISLSFAHIELTRAIACSQHEPGHAPFGKLDRLQALLHNNSANDLFLEFVEPTMDQSTRVSSKTLFCCVHQ